MKYEVLFLSLVIVSILSLLVPIDSVYAAGGSNKPNKPTDVTSVLTSKITVKVSWVAPTDEGASPITGYQIERRILGGTWEIIEDDTGNTSTSFDDPELLIKNATYDYRVRAINSYGLGQPAKNDHVITMSGSSRMYFDTKTQHC